MHLEGRVHDHADDGVFAEERRRLREQRERDDDGAHMASVVLQDVEMPRRGHAFRRPALDPDAVGGARVDRDEGRQRVRDLAAEDLRRDVNDFVQRDGKRIDARLELAGTRDGV